MRHFIGFWLAFVATLADARSPIVWQGNNAKDLTLGLSTGTLTTTGAATIGGTLTATGGIVGTTTNDDACAGCVGQYIEGTTTSGTKTTATTTNWDSISLTAGDWDVSATVYGRMNTATGLGSFEWGISLNSASYTGVTFGTGELANIDLAGGTTSNYKSAHLYRRVKVANGSTQTVYLINSISAISSGGVTLAGRLRARRIR
jgi:hypothetical protein